MIQQEFNTQMQRLASHFGKNTYTPELLTLVWREFQDVDAQSFRVMADRWIGELDRAPRLTIMREDLSKWRERRYEQRKREERQDAKDFWLGTYQPDDVKTICQYIKRRLAGGVNDQDWDNFLKHLNEAAAGAEQMTALRSAKLSQG